MDVRIVLEWDEQVGISLSKMYPLREGIEEALKKRTYGQSILSLWIVMTARGYDFKQRKRFKKIEARFEYDILLDFFLIKNVPMEEKRRIIRKQIIDISEQTFSKYKFDDFDKNAFLSDLKEIVDAIEW
ncbi:MAG: hypothetical protein DI535_23150 [Citrobacter freundii]|nr:MAG: hypothetical protein DI535_23150 [Citrobacter freundii]